MTDEKSKAIPFLEQAILNYSATMPRKNHFKEQRAPIDAFFSLALPIELIMNLKRLLNTYSKINELLPEKGELENADFIDQQINACRNAIKFIEDCKFCTKRTWVLRLMSDQLILTLL